MYLSKNTQLKYILAVVLFIWFFNTGYVPTISFIVALVFATAYIYYDIDTSEKNVNDSNLELNYMLNSLLYEEGKKAPDHFYLEPDLIIFFYNIREYRIYNRDTYLKAIKCANNVLKLRKELENDYFYREDEEMNSWQNFGYTSKNVKKTNIKNLKEISELIEKFAIKSLNYIHSFAVALPPHFKKKHQESIARYHILIRRITDDVYFHCKKYSDNPLVIQSYGTPKPYVKGTSFDFF